MKRLRNFILAGCFFSLVLTFSCMKPASAPVEPVGDEVAEGLVAEHIKIDAPSSAPAGTLVVLVANGDSDTYRWTCYPETLNFMVVEDGRRAVFCSPTPGEFNFVLSGSKSLPHDHYQTSHIIVIEGDDPGPAPGPGPGPAPGPTAKWSKFAKETAEKVVEGPDRAKEAKAMAAALKATAAASAAGAFPDARSYREETRQKIYAAFIFLHGAAEGRTRWIHWNSTFDKALEEAITAAFPDLSSLTQKQWQKIRVEVADGLEEVE